MFTVKTTKSISYKTDVLSNLFITLTFKASKHLLNNEWVVYVKYRFVYKQDKNKL